MQPPKARRAATRTRPDQNPDKAIHPTATNRKGIGDRFTPAAGQHGPLGGRVSANRCFATVMLDEELWRSLVTIGGQHQVAWVHGCILEYGHRGDHRALAYRAGAQAYWLQWDENRKPCVNTATESSPPGSQARPRLEPLVQPQQVAPPTIAEASLGALPEQLDPPISVPWTDALWAIAAALERLADVITAAVNPNEEGGRHRSDRGNDGS